MVGGFHPREGNWSDHTASRYLLPSQYVDNISNRTRATWSWEDLYCRYETSRLQFAKLADCHAEAVSEWLRRPFLPLTVADLGTIETSIEQNLTTWFDLAEVWNAVLLVDEADIFLEQRKNKDLYRNGLVTGNNSSRQISKTSKETVLTTLTAFLRRMEYFKGLLFLTTNRVGQIDDAFISRVHVAIEYPALTPSYRSRIWKAFFAKLHTERKGKIKVSPRAQAYVLGKEMELNGREIRNALQTAIALAEYEARTQEGLEGDEMVTVEQGHFEDVLGMCESFHEYVGSIRREDEKKRASGRGDRNDYGD
jgi:hypothetical protein